MPGLTVIVGAEKGKTLEVKPGVKFIMGRDPSGGLYLTDHGASRHHAEIFDRDNIFYIKDLNSTNGTFVNGVRITEQILKDKDHIRIGENLFMFEEAVKVKEDKPIVKETDQPIGEEEIEAPTVEIKLDGDVTAKTPPAVGKELTSQKLTTLYEISKIITSEKNPARLLNRALKLTVEATKADQGYILAWEKDSDKITPRTVYPKQTKELKISRTVVKRVAQYTRPLLSSDVMLDARLGPSESAVMSNIKSVICTPMISTARSEGVLYLLNDKLGRSFSRMDLELATSVAIQLGLALITRAATEKARRALLSMIKTLVTSSEIRNPKTRGHSERVANFSTALATQLGLARSEIHNLQLGALLHDIGKIAEPPLPPDSPYQTDSLGKGEHVRLGEKLLGEIEDFKTALPGIKYHHEKVDGTGFPYGAKREEIPLIAKIISVANVLDNLISYGGTHGEGLPVKEVLTEIKQQAGTEFDDEVAEALMSCHEKGTLFSTQISFEDVLHK